MPSTIIRLSEEMESPRVGLEYCLHRARTRWSPTRRLHPCIAPRLSDREREKKRTRHETHDVRRTGTPGVGSCPSPERKPGLLFVVRFAARAFPSATTASRQETTEYPLEQIRRTFPTTAQT